MESPNYPDRPGLRVSKSPRTLPHSLPRPIPSIDGHELRLIAACSSAARPTTPGLVGGVERDTGRPDEAGRLEPPRPPMGVVGGVVGGIARDPGGHPPGRPPGPPVGVAPCPGPSPDDDPGEGVAAQASGGGGASPGESAPSSPAGPPTYHRAVAALAELDAAERDLLAAARSVADCPAADQGSLAMRILALARVMDEAEGRAVAAVEAAGRTVGGPGKPCGPIPMVVVGGEVVMVVRKVGMGQGGLGGGRRLVRAVAGEGTTA